MNDNNKFKVRTRFAPSPTGFMHIGNLRSALYEYLIAKSEGGKFILRIEDTDKERYVDGAEEIIYKTLKLSNLVIDEGPDTNGEYGPYVQSKRLDIYKKWAYELINIGKAYYCFCKKTEKIENNSYSKHNCECRDFFSEKINENLKNNKEYVIRQKMPYEGITTFYDEVFGEISVKNSELEDQILLKSDFFPTYNFANVIDDHLMNITHVVRGCEYLSSTPKYNLIYDALNWPIPKYIHLPLILGKDENGVTSKLSKRNGSLSFDELLNEGFLPEAIINYIAFLGWCPESQNEIYSLSELEKEFKINRISKSPSIFDIKKLMWFNSEYIKNKNIDEFSKIIKDFLTNDPVLDYLYKKKILKLLDDTDNKLCILLKTRISKLNEISDIIDFLVDFKEINQDLFYNKKSKTTEENVPVILKDIYSVFLDLKNWNQENIKEMFLMIAQHLNIKNASVMWVARIAVTGKLITPGGSVEIFDILGKNETILRLKKVLEYFKISI